MAQDDAVAAGHSVEAGLWPTLEGQLLDQIAGRFPRVETRQRLARFLRGMVAELPRKTCWSIAEHAGETSPEGMQHLLNRASWDTEASTIPASDPGLTTTASAGVAPSSNPSGSFLSGTRQSC